MIDSGILIDGRYEVQGHLGDGGMGSVFKAHELELERTVAIKFLHADLLNASEQRARFDREGKVLSTISHPNLLSCYRFGVWQSKPYIVMEYLEGKSLRQLLSGPEDGTDSHAGSEVMQVTAPAVTPFQWQRAVLIAISICQGMHYAHAHGIIHRDLKPNNIVLVQTGATELVKVVDFGLARVLNDSGQVNQHLTQTGAVMGTLFYLSPEQCTGQRGDHRSDIYALGCLLYELITGRAPFYSDNPVAILQKHATEAPQKLPVRLHAPAELNTILFKALAKKPEDRYQSMQEMQTDLDRLLSDRLEEIEGTVPPVRGPRWQRTLVYCAMATMAMSCIGALLWLNSDDGVAAMTTLPLAPENRKDGVTVLLQKSSELAKQRPGAATKLLERALRLNGFGTTDMNTANILVNLAELREIAGRKREAITAAEETLSLISTQITMRTDASPQEKNLTIQACKVLKRAGMFYPWEYRRFSEKHRRWYNDHPSIIDNALLEQRSARCDLALSNIYKTIAKKSSQMRAAVLSLSEPPLNTKDKYYQAHIQMLISEAEEEEGLQEHADKEFESARQILASFAPPAPYELAGMLALRAEQLSKQGRDAEAWTLMMQARDILRTNQMPPVQGFIDETSKDATSLLVHARQRISEALYRAGDLAGAREQIVEAVRLAQPYWYDTGESRLVSIYGLATNLLARTGQSDEALALIDKGLLAGAPKRHSNYLCKKEQVPYNPVGGAFHSIRGQLLLDRGDFKAAEEEFKIALDILSEREDNNSESIANTRRTAWCGLIECFIQSRREKLALPLLETLINANTEAATSDRSLAHLLLARIYLYLGRETEASTEVEKSGKCDKKQCAAAGLAGLALVRDCELLSRYSLALQFESKIPHPKHPDTLGPVALRAALDTSCGNACLATKKFKAAEDELHHALNLLNKHNKGATSEYASLYSSLYALELLTSTNKLSEAAQQLNAKARSFQTSAPGQAQRLRLELKRWEILSTLFCEDEAACDKALLDQETEWRKVPGCELEAARSYQLISRFAKDKQRERYLNKAIQLYETRLGPNHPALTDRKKRLRNDARETAGG